MRRLATVFATLTFCLSIIGLAWAEFVVTRDFDNKTSLTADDVITKNAFIVMAHSTSALGEGTVVVPYFPANCGLTHLCVEPASAADSQKIIGVVERDAADGVDPRVVVAGRFSIQVSGTVSKGDLLKVSDTEDGKAMTTTSGQGVFAVATTDSTEFGYALAVFTVTDTY